MGFSLGSEAQAGCALGRGSFEFAARGGLVKPDAARGDIRFEIIFTLDRGIRQTAEHGDLADVIEGVGDGTLEDSFDGLVERLGGGGMIVELFYGGQGTRTIAVSRALAAGSPGCG